MLTYDQIDAMWILSCSYEKGTVSVPSSEATCSAPQVFTGLQTDWDHAGDADFHIESVQRVDEPQVFEALEDSMRSMSIQEDSLDVDEVQANDLMNSTIELEEDMPEEPIEECETSDDEYVPSIYIRTGGALPQPPDLEKLPVIGVDEAVHGVPQPQHPEEDIYEFPNPVMVQNEDDLIGKQACIAYEDSLRQLGTFLQLPINKCTYADPLTGTECSCFPPFEVKLKRRGTAVIMEWIQHRENTDSGVFITPWTFGMQPRTSQRN
ncbi:hypothetical protein ABVT39_016034 [Epinephelus coioides]